MLKKSPTPNVRRNRDSVQARSLTGPRAFDELVALQSIKRIRNDRAFVAEKACDVVGVGETYTMVVYESQYIPLTERRDAQIVQAASEREFLALFAFQGGACFWLHSYRCCRPAAVIVTHSPAAVIVNHRSPEVITCRPHAICIKGNSSPALAGAQEKVRKSDHDEEKVAELTR